MQWDIIQQRLHPVAKQTLFLSGYALFVLLLFQPFGTYEYRHSYKWLQLCGYALLVPAVYPAARTTLHAVFKDRNSPGKEALLLFTAFILLILAAFFYHALVIIGELRPARLFPFVVNGLIFLLPPYVFLLYRERKHQTQAEAVQTAGDKLEIKGSSPYEQFYFNADDIVYLRSNGNYVTVYFQKDGLLKSEMIRNTLSQVSGQLGRNKFTAIHRSFLVNTKKFDRLIRENGKTLLLSRQFDTKLPVSRTKLDELEKKMRDHR